MGKLVVFAAEKGGVGKTTLSTNIAGLLAINGHSTMLVDTDVDGQKGRYASDWIKSRRQIPGLPTVVLSMAQGQIYNDLQSYRDAYGAVVVDVPAGNGIEMRLACSLADVIVIPVRIGQYDTKGLEPMLEIAAMVRSERPDVRILSVLSDVPFNAKNDLEDSEGVLDTLSAYMRRTRKHIVSRQAFRDSAKSGRVVTELVRRDPKASDELLSLYEEIFHD
jgi:chromosome partitioning protein